MMPRLLIVDDEKSMRDFLGIVLTKEGYDVTLAGSGEEAIELLRRESFDVIIADLRMQKLDGLEILKTTKNLSPETQVIMITAYSSTETAVEAMKRGAFDYITKPFKVDEIKIIIKNAVEKKRLQDENIYLKKQLKEKYRFENIIGISQKMVEIFNTIATIADTKSTVVITGESGTGKELIARAIHFNSQRKDKPFISVNCGAIPEGLMESELFGHTKGAFTGAISTRDGLFQAADQGTLFLDEITEISPLLQVKLLRAIQEKTIRRVGDTKDIKLDVRLIAASNRNLQNAMEDGTLREDLFYRLNVISIHIPQLRERTEDIPLLADSFLTKYSRELDKKITGFSQEAMGMIEAYKWPGNVRELENVIERAVAFCAGDVITAEYLPDHFKKRRKSFDIEFEIPEEGFDLENEIERLEKDLIIKAMERSGGVQKRAAELLGMNFRSFRYKIQKYGIDLSR